MKKQDFLHELVKEGKIELVEPSENLCKSYLQKSDNCLRSAKILLENKLYENSISMSYYAMYNSLLALFFRIGIKSENHSGSILLFKKIFKRQDLFKYLSKAKNERIEKQYYVASKENMSSIRESAKRMFGNAEKAVIQLKIIAREMKNQNIEKLRKEFGRILE